MGKLNRILNKLGVAVFLAALTAIIGCGGGSYPNQHATPPGIGNTPPPINMAHHWSCSFEDSEGYALGSVFDQNGWYNSYTSASGSSVTVSTDMAATGSHSLKFDVPNSKELQWWENVTCVGGPSIVPDVELKSVTYRMKVYREPGETAFPADSTTMRSNIWFNQYGYTPVSPVRYVDFGDAPTDLKLHASMMNSTPRIWDDPGFNQIAGRFVEVVIFDDFEHGIRIVWYDGVRAATVPIFNASKKYWTFTLGYQAINAGDADGVGKPMYIDDIDVSWVPVTE